MNNLSAIQGSTRINAARSGGCSRIAPRLSKRSSLVCATKSGTATSHVQDLKVPCLYYYLDEKVNPCWMTRFNEVECSTLQLLQLKFSILSFGKHRLLGQSSSLIGWPQHSAQNFSNLQRIFCYSLTDLTAAQILIAYAFPDMMHLYLDCASWHGSISSRPLVNLHAVSPTCSTYINHEFAHALNLFVEDLS